MPYRNAKKIIYLEPPIPGSKTVRRRVTRIIPAPAPPPPPPVRCETPPPPPPPVQCLPPPSPPPQLCAPEESDIIDVIAVDVEEEAKPHKKAKSKKSSKSRSGSRSSREQEREVFFERDRFVPMRPPQPEYETYRYVEAPRRRTPPAALPAPEPRGADRTRIVIEDHRRQREYY